MPIRIFNADRRGLDVPMTAVDTASRTGVPVPPPQCMAKTQPAAGLAAPRRVRAISHAGGLPIEALLGGSVGGPSVLDVDPRLLLVKRSARGADDQVIRRTLLPPSDERREEREQRRRRTLAAASIVLGSVFAASAVTVALG